ncbi:MAG: bifunctional adenosylcobinamide kinase/adenosylcobinamide-phosphate guanylyltransferase [Nitrosomonadaceae bacterium]|nr:bifunctional adenosylcobinamide kinase/adenosylcobinamide-phosphate guanylyltransferase [Nitrosomonadaceae bacterium]
MTRTLVLGGTRSGKSIYAEKLAMASDKEVIYIATAQAGDAEMTARIARHRQQRNHAWITVEEPLALGTVIAKWSRPDRLILVDCLTIWLSNLLFIQEQAFPDVGEIIPPACFSEQRECFLYALKNAVGDVILVSNEIGMGVVPQGAISRWFVDEAGCLNQAVAASCERTVWVAAGLPLLLKG